MADQAEKPYRDLEEIPLEDLAQLMQLLRDVRVSPTDLLAYACALDVLENHAENLKEEGSEEMTVEDTLEVEHEVEADDGSLVDDLYAGARLCLIKMNKLEAH
jgi:hypothetical protein